MSELTEIPSIGKTIAKNLARINITEVKDFEKQDPQSLYEAWCAVAQNPSDTDRCVLYTFRCAVYYANGGRDPELLKWWNWKDK
jgi:Pathogenicity locus.